jgi:branched-chain amino acid transport system permease protein
MRLGRSTIAYLIFFSITCAVPFVSSPVVTDVLIFCVLYAFVSTAWTIAVYAGPYSIGHAAYFGLGAYSTALLYTRLGISPWIGILVGVAISSSFALVISYPVFRYGIKGYYYTLTTLAVAEIMRTIFLAWDITGRAVGVWYHVVPDSLWHFQFHTSHAPYVFIGVAFLILGVFTSNAIKKARLGLAFSATRDDEDTAQSVGINTLRHKLTAVAISAALTSIGGAFFAQYTLFIEPDTSMAMFVSVDILLPAVVGGVGTVSGPLIGSFLLTPLIWILRIAFGSEVLHVVIRGVVIIIVVLFAPEGIVGTLGKHSGAAGKILSIVPKRLSSRAHR